MSLIQTGIEYSVAGRKIVFIDDFVGDISSSHLAEEIHSYSSCVESYPGCDGIYFAENSITKAKAMYEGAEVYGVWQIAISNGLIDFSRPLHIIRSGEGAGWYLIVSVNGSDVRCETSGRFKADHIPTKEAWTIEDAAEVVIDLDTIELPAVSAKTRIEINTENSFKERKQVLIGVAGAALIFIATFITQQLIASSHEAKKREVVALKSEVVQLKEDLERIKSTRKPEKPDYEVFISRLESLSKMDSNLTSAQGGSAEGGTSLRTGNFSLISKNKKFLLVEDMFAWLEAKLLPSGDILLTPAGAGQ